MYEKIKCMVLTSFSINNTTDLNCATTQDTLIHNMIYDYINQDSSIREIALHGWIGLYEEVTIKDDSAFYIDAESIYKIENTLNSKINALHIYEVTEDKIDNTKLKLITLGDKEVNCKLDTKAVVTFSLNATLSIITSNLILVLDALGYYESWIDWLKHLDEVKVVTNNKIDIIKELEETKENSSYKALKERIVSFTKDNEEHINELIRQWQEELIENMNKMKH